MGGIGSTRWINHHKRTAVEHCLALPVRAFVRALPLSAGVRGSGVVVQVAAQEPSALARFEIDTTTPADAWVQLSYQVLALGRRVTQRIALAPMRPGFGGCCWYFLCTQRWAGEPCGARVRTLYFPPDGRAFSCRVCHDLTYLSCQESHQFDRGVAARAAALMGLRSSTWHAMTQGMAQLQRRQRGRQHPLVVLPDAAVVV
jgi:hypothetical protein